MGDEEVFPGTDTAREDAGPCFSVYKVFDDPERLLTGGFGYVLEGEGVFRVERAEHGAWFPSHMCFFVYCLGYHTGACGANTRKRKVGGPRFFSSLVLP